MGSRTCCAPGSSTPARGTLVFCPARDSAISATTRVTLARFDTGSQGGPAVQKPVLAALCALVLASCSSSSSSAPTHTATTLTNLYPGATVPNATDTPQTIDPCTLLTVADTSNLAHAAVRRSSGGGPGSLDCIYAGVSAGAEVTVKVDKNAATAIADFPSWVQPIPGFAPGLKVTRIARLGDEATVTRNGKINAGIYVRKGAVLIKIGAHPAPTNAALQFAVTTALGRV